MKKHHNSRTQLTSYHRFQLLKYLSLGFEIPKIAKFLGFNKSTIYRELSRNTIVENRINQNFNGSKTISCKNASKCKDKKKDCTINCHKHIALTCPLITKPYQICNFCIRKNKCNYERVIYHPEIAHDKSQNRRKNGKTAIKLTDDQLKALDQYVSPLIINGQSIEVIESYSSKKDFPVTTRTLRNYIDKCLMTARNIDLRRKVRYSPSKKGKSQRTYISDPLKKIDHLYEDYVHYMEQNPDLTTIQCDTLNGKRHDKKCVLSLHADKINFQLFILVSNKTTGRINQAFLSLKRKLGKPLYYRIFRVILADNGTEFDNITDLEKDNDDCYQTKVFYTRPYRTNDKSKCERNHELFRYIKEKGKTLDDLTEHDIFLINSHVNSYPRKSLGWKTPIELLKKLYGDEVVGLLGIQEIKRQNVKLTSRLIKNK